jgi:hypothetical protein
MAIVDIDDFVRYFGSETNADIADMTSALAGAEYAVKRHCHRDFTVATDTATPRVFVPESDTVVRVDDFASTTGLVVTNDGSTIAAAGYQLEPLNGIDLTGEAVPYTTVRLVTGLCWTRTYRRATVSVTARWGWSTIPDDVVEATKILAKDLVHHRETRFGVAGWGQFGVVRMRENPTVLSLLQRVVRMDRVGF